MNYNQKLIIGNQKYNVYMTKNIQEIEKGLMYVTELESNGGILLSYEKEDYYGIWMKNVCIPLDVVWISEQNIILDIKSLQVNLDDPESTITYVDKKSKYTLEVNAGTFTGKIGDEIFFKEINN